MRLKNNGFAISVVLYGLLILFLLLIIFMVGLMSSYKSNTDNLIGRDNGAKDLVDQMVEKENMTVIGLENDEEVRCKSKTYETNSYVIDSKDIFINTFLTICDYNKGCYFFEEDVLCDFTSCKVKYFDECIPETDDTPVKEEYANRKPYKKAEEVTCLGGKVPHSGKCCMVASTGIYATGEECEKDRSSYSTADFVDEKCTNKSFNIYTECVEP